jgi:hypothetical protein
VADKIEEILMFRPAIDAGIVTLVPGGFEWCEKHLAQRFPEYDGLRKIKEQLCERSRSEFAIRVVPGSCQHRLRSELCGPSEFIEHGFLATHYSRVPDWIPARCAGGAPAELSAEEVRASGVVDDLFERIARDVFIHKAYGSAFSATYLTNLEGEAIFLQRTNCDSLAVETAHACKTLAHSIPIFSDLSIDTIVRLRRENPESFVRYRNALAGIIRDHVQNPKGLSVRDARVIYADWLKPELDSLEAATRNKWKPAVNVARRTAVTAAVVALGVHAKLLTTDASEILKALGLSTVANALDGAIAEVGATPADIKNHSLYFLLKARREQEKAN